MKRTAIISGGCGGVGRAVGKKLSGDGFDVAVLYRATPPAEAEKVLGTFAPGNHCAFQCDLRDSGAVNAAIESVEKRYGTIHACVHAAGNAVIRKNILELKNSELDAQLTASFWGGVHLFSAVAPLMKREGKGVLIGILSRVVAPGMRYPRMAGITIAKYALRGLLKELHGELAPFHIAVNAIAPDFMDTPLNRDLPPAVRTFLAERAATGNIKTPEEVARAVSYLCSEEGKSVQGKIFSFDENEVALL